MTTNFDSIIIGTGQAGPSLAGRLAGSGMKVAIVERKLFGGTCVNTGCIPTKTMVASAYAAHMARRAAVFGVNVGADVTVDMRRVKARKDAVSGKSRKGVETSLKQMKNCTVYEGHARFESAREVSVGERRLASGRIFINVGARAVVPAMQGLDQVDYLTNSSMMAVDFLPRHLIVIGGSYVGLEFGQMFRRFGSEVTIVEMGPRPHSAAVRLVFPGPNTGATAFSRRAASSAAQAGFTPSSSGSGWLASMRASGNPRT